MADVRSSVVADAETLNEWFVRNHEACLSILLYAESPDETRRVEHLALFAFGARAQREGHTVYYLLEDIGEDGQFAQNSIGTATSWLDWIGPVDWVRTFDLSKLMTVGGLSVGLQTLDQLVTRTLVMTVLADRVDVIVTACSALTTIPELPDLRCREVCFAAPLAVASNGRDKLTFSDSARDQFEALMRTSDSELQSACDLLGVMPSKSSLPGSMPVGLSKKLWNAHELIASWHGLPAANELADAFLARLDNGAAHRRQERAR